MLLHWIASPSSTGTRTTTLSSQVRTWRCATATSKCPRHCPEGWTSDCAPRPPAYTTAPTVRVCLLVHVSDKILTCTHRGGGACSLHAVWLQQHLQGRRSHCGHPPGGAEGTGALLPPSPARVEDTGHQQPGLWPAQQGTLCVCVCVCVCVRGPGASWLVNVFKKCICYADWCA